MTSQIKFRIVVVVASILIAGNSFAQSSPVNSLQSSLDKTSIKIYQNVVEEFQKMFEGATNVRWLKMQKGFLAKFSIGDLDKRALLSPRGHLKYEISYGKEKHLPTDIRKSVKGNYVEYLITSASLVEEANRSIWVINLENECEYVIVRFENNEMEEVKRYNKANL